ncbi:MAG: hypothetical protein JW751_10605 [Polyangiaceae bacterium]|nr:hypothetical protein [Polyangiaceae bacterium]
MPVATPHPFGSQSPPVIPGPSPRRSPQRTAAYVFGFAGVAAVGVGSYFGVAALDRRGEAEDLCPESPCTNRDGVELGDQAFDNADRANVLLGAGAAFIMTGAVLYLTAPRHRESSALTLAPRNRGAVIGLYTKF